MATVKKWEPEHSFGGLVILLGNFFSKALNRKLKEHGLPLSLPKVLILNSLRDKELSQVEIASLLKQEAASVTEVLSDMRDQKLVDWHPDDNDGRSKRWFITKSGSALVKKCESLFRGAGEDFDHFFLNITQFQNVLRSNRTTLLKIYENIGRKVGINE